jgi:hypothetical protein
VNDRVTVEPLWLHVTAVQPGATETDGEHEVLVLSIVSPPGTVKVRTGFVTAWLAVFLK